MNKKITIIFIMAVAICWASRFLMLSFIDNTKNDLSYTIASNFHLVRTIEPSDSNFTDLGFLKKTLDSCDIVLLGEQQHGDGTTFEAKSRIINYLHQKMGFNILAFEASFEDCLYFSPTDNSVDSFTKALYPFWATASQTIFLRNQLKMQNNTMSFVGFDLQWTGQVSNTERTQRIQTILNRNQLKMANFPNFSSILDSITYYTGRYKSTHLSKIQKKTILQELDSIIKQIKGENEDDRRIMLNISDYFYYRWMLSEEEQKEWRDKKMAENIIWLKEKKYPHKKIILWAANMHGISLDSLNNFYSFITMGQYLKKKYKDAYYALSFTSFEGTTYNIATQSPNKINESMTNSLEYFLHNEEIMYGFIDFRRQPFEQKKRAYYSKILGHANYLEQWSNATDGLFFINKMEAANVQSNQ